MMRALAIAVLVVTLLVPGLASAQESSPLAYQDADEFQKWWDADSARLAEVIKKIGKVEVK